MNPPKVKNSHLAKSERNQRIKRLLAKGWKQAEVAKEFNITVQRINDLVQKWIWRGLLVKTEQGFAMSDKDGTPAKIIRN